MDPVRFKTKEDREELAVSVQTVHEEDLQLFKSIVDAELNRRAMLVGTAPLHRDGVEL